MKRRNTHDPKKSYQEFRRAITIAQEEFEGAKARLRAKDKCYAFRGYISAEHFYATAMTHAKYADVSVLDNRDLYSLSKAMEHFEEDLRIALGCE